MDRRALLVTLAGGILVAPLAVEARPTGKVYRIGYLTVPSRETAQGVANTFQLGLTDKGRGVLPRHRPGYRGRRDRGLVV